MEIPDLTFRLNVECNCSLDEFMNWFRDDWTDLNIEWNTSKKAGSTLTNWIEFGENGDYNPDLIESEDGWYYYHYYILAARKGKPPRTKTDFEDQLEFVRLLKERLGKKGCLVKVNASFEKIV